MTKTLPWTVKIETTEGCNRSCVFCPVPKIYGKNYSYLQPSTAAEIVDQILAWNPERKWRFEFAMLGEPTMNKSLPNIIAEIRRIPKAQITVFSNGDIIKGKPQLAMDLFKAGVNVLAIDCYDKENLDFYENIVKYKPKYNFHKDGYKLYATKNRGWELKDLVIINDLATTQDLKSVRSMHNYGGNVDNSLFGIYSTEVKAGCEKPFRDLVISHKGDVLICCLDANKDVKVGNIYEEPIKDIWYGKKFMDIRRDLVAGNRIGRPCDTCSFFGGFKRFIAFEDFKSLL